MSDSRGLIEPVATVDVKGIKCGEVPMFLICGPCVIEEDATMKQAAETLTRVQENLGIPIIYKSSFQKDNRSAGENYRGPGLEKGLRVLEDIGRDYGFPLLSDIHYPDQVDEAADVLDIIQVPAFLCMQTDLAEKTALTQKVVNIKHGQFLAPENMELPVEKIKRMGNDRIMVTERGYSFGYNDLIVDPRSFYLMRQIGYPVIFDITHSVRRYGIPSADPKGGNREFLSVLARSAVGAGVDGLFIESHPNPPEAWCDAASQLWLSDLEEFLKPLLEINAVIKERNSGTIH